MNLKVSHLVSIQFGIFVGIVSCLVLFRFENARPHAAVEMRKPATERAPAVQPTSEREDEASDLMDDATASEESNRFTEQPAPAMPNEYSPEAVEKSMAILTKLYYEQIAPRRTARSDPANGSIAAIAPSYSETIQEPPVVPVDNPAPQTVVYEQPAQVIVYPQPVQFVVISQPRRFVNRCRPASQAGVPASNSHRRQHNGGTHLIGLPHAHSPGSLAVVPGGSIGVANCPPMQGFPRGKQR